MAPSPHFPLTGTVAQRRDPERTRRPLHFLFVSAPHGQSLASSSQCSVFVLRLGRPACLPSLRSPLRRSQVAAALPFRLPSLQIPVIRRGDLRRLHSHAQQVTPVGAVRPRVPWPCPPPSRPRPRSPASSLPAAAPHSCGFPPSSEPSLCAFLSLALRLGFCVAPAHSHPSFQGLASFPPSEAPPPRDWAPCADPQRAPWSVHSRHATAWPLPGTGSCARTSTCSSKVKL